MYVCEVFGSVGWGLELELVEVVKGGSRVSYVNYIGISLEFVLSVVFWVGNSEFVYFFYKV